MTTLSNEVNKLVNIITAGTHVDNDRSDEAVETVYDLVLTAITDPYNKEQLTIILDSIKTKLRPFLATFSDGTNIKDEAVASITTHYVQLVAAQFRSNVSQIAGHLLTYSNHGVDEKVSLAAGITSLIGFLEFSIRNTEKVAGVNIQ